MKSLIVLATLLMSAQTFASSGECFTAARTAAFRHAVKEEIVETIAEFDDLLDSETLDVEHHGSWQKEYWSFYNWSMFFNVEVDFVKGKCLVKKVGLSQNDQDED